MVYILYWRSRKPDLRWRKQKLLLRALYKKFNTLILDEATSAMDNKSEELIMNEIFDIQNKTIIIIAHRLTTVKNCDIILEFESGKNN